MKMRLALNQWSLWKELRDGTLSIEQFVRGAAERGFNSVEFLDYQFDESEQHVESVKALCGELGISVCAYAIRNDFATPFFGQQIEEGNRVKSGLKTAEALGAPLLRVLGGRVAEGLNFDDAEARMIEALQMAIDFAAPKGIRLALENWGQLCGRTEQIIELVDAIGSPTLGVTVDLGNFLLVDEDPANSVRVMNDRITHVHLNDFRESQEPSDEVHVLTSSQGRHFRGTVIGEGVVPISEVLEALSEMNYPGHLSLEYEGSLPGWEGVDKSLACLREHFSLI